MTIRYRWWCRAALFCLYLGALGAQAEQSVMPYMAGSYAASSANGEGAVASVHPLATRAGLDALEQGGNAVDAAVAVALTLGVVDGHNSGIGGGAFALVRWADGRIEAWDGREMAAAAAHRDMYLRDGRADGQLSKHGALAVGVPGSLLLYDQLLRRGGQRDLAHWLLPAAALAERGYPLPPLARDRMRASAEQLCRFPAAAAIFLASGCQLHPPGYWLRQPDLAATYRAIAAEGVGYFYRGAFAEKLAAWMAANGGIITREDMAAYQLRQRQPIVSSYRGYTVVGFPPPSSGGVHVAQILNILSQFDLAGASQAQRDHLLAEAMRRAFADRAEYLGDADYVEVPRGLLSEQYAAQLAAAIDLTRASAQVTAGSPPDRQIDLFGKHTTHIATADRQGNWVSITATVNTSYGAKVVVPGTGVVLNNQMDDFSSQPGVPNAFGLVGSEANSIAPGKRPLSSMSPTLVLEGDRPLISLGAAGGPTIITQVVQNLVNILDLGMSPQQALAAARLHHQWRPQTLFVDSAFPPARQAALQALGHSVTAREFAGASQLIMRRGEAFISVSEPRVIARNSELESR